MSAKGTPLCCPFCAAENPPHVLVCSSCARDIAIPETLLRERDDLRRKLAAARQELAAASAELEAYRHGRRGASRPQAS